MDDAKKIDVDEERREDRYAAEQEFERSLSQLENLLSLEANGQAMKTHSMLDATQKIEPHNRFGGSLFDAIPLVHQLANCLSNLPESSHLAHSDNLETLDASEAAD